LLKNTA